MLNGIDQLVRFFLSAGDKKKKGVGQLTRLAKELYDNF